MLNPAARALAERECVPCRAGGTPLKGAELEKYREELDADWRIVDEHHLEKDLRPVNYLAALPFVEAVARLADRARHHPDVTLSSDRVRIVIFTHKIDGLHQNDFILAARIEHEIERFRELWVD